jgi:hypothetical protein
MVYPPLHYLLEIFPDSDLRINFERRSFSEIPYRFACLLQEWVGASNFGSHGTDAGCEARPEVEENSPRRLELNELLNRVIRYAIEVHRGPDPGLLGPTY